MVTDGKRMPSGSMAKFRAHQLGADLCRRRFEES